MEEKSSLRLSSIRPHCKCMLCKLVMRYQQRESMTKTTNCRPWQKKWRERDWPVTLLKLPVRDKLSYSRRTLVSTKEWQLKPPEKRASCQLGVLLKVPVKDKPHYSKRIHTCERKRMATEAPVEMEVRLQWMRDRLAATIIADKT